MLEFDRPPFLADQRRFDTPLTIGVVADTHIYGHGRRWLPEEVPDLFKRFGAGLILHAGDASTLAVLETLGEAAPVLAVAGNSDDAELLDLLPTSLRFEVGRFSFALLHGHGGQSARQEARRLFAGQVDCAVYGHSHIPLIEVENGTILFNPGSATDRRWQEHFGVGLIHVSDEKIDPELVLYDDPRHLRNVKAD